MEKYSSLIWGGLLTVAAIAVIVWIMRDGQNAVNNALGNTPTSPDEDGVEPLNGLSPLNAEVTVAGTHLTYNVPQPGNVPAISGNQDYLTSAQLSRAGVDTADWSIDNLLQVNLPASDFIN